VVQVGKVETAKAKEKKRTWVEDELSTLPGATVTVTPFGNVRVKRKAGWYPGVKRKLGRHFPEIHKWRTS
jgi:hypothetical protein